MPVVEITDATFEAEVLGSELPVLIDFYADWCQPCKALAPKLEKLSGDYSGAVKFVKVDVEANPAVAQAFQIRSMPTLMLLSTDGPGGQPQLVDALMGNQPEEAIEAMLQKVAAKPQAGVELFDPKRAKLAAEIDAVVFVDVRDKAHFDRARLPKAVSAAPELREETFLKLAQAPGPTYVFYDRTDAGVHDVAEAAASAGVKAGVLQGGLLAWEGELLPVEKP